MPPWWSPSRHIDRRPALLTRNRIKQAISAWFLEQGFVEVDPGALVVSPGNELHLHAFRTQLIGNDGAGRPVYLHTSPEFACKKLIAAGERRIFTFAPTYRDAERGPLHAPEFTMLEWYRADDDGAEQYETVQGDCGEILKIAAATAGRNVWRWRNASAAADRRPRHRTVAEALLALTGFDIAATLAAGAPPDRDGLAARLRERGWSIHDGETWGDLFSKLMAELERDGLPAPVSPDASPAPAVILDRYPAAMSPLARPAPEDCRFALRFELFAAGIELANGFGEETDSDKVRAALTAEMDEKQRVYGERYPIDAGFIAALAGMPRGTAGCALGFDRLVMLATGATHIDQVLWTPLPE